MGNCSIAEPTRTQAPFLVDSRSLDGPWSRLEASCSASKSSSGAWISGVRNSRREVLWARVIADELGFCCFSIKEWRVGFTRWTLDRDSTTGFHRWIVRAQCDTYVDSLAGSTLYCPQLTYKIKEALDHTIKHAVAWFSILEPMTFEVCDRPIRGARWWPKIASWRDHHVLMELAITKSPRPAHCRDCPVNRLKGSANKSKDWSKRSPASSSLLPHRIPCSQLSAPFPIWWTKDLAAMTLSSKAWMLLRKSYSVEQAKYMTFIVLSRLLFPAYQSHFLDFQMNCWSHYWTLLISMVLEEPIWLPRYCQDRLRDLLWEWWRPQRSSGPFPLFSSVSSCHVLLGPWCKLEQNWNVRVKWLRSPQRGKSLDCDVKRE